VVPGRLTIYVGYETPGVGFRGRLVGRYDFTVR
jgi:hypothetical protein